MSWKIQEFKWADAKLVYLNINDIDEELKRLINDNISEICYGDSSFSITKAKKYILDFINTKSQDRKNGAIAEFFLHVYLKSINMQQECIFKNLEESSFKKGFDGVYKDQNNVVWYMESKSGDASICQHKTKVEEAYRDLVKKFTSQTENDPWLNAYYHVKAINADQSLLDKFLKYSDDFDKNISHELNDFCIIPCGTIVGPFSGVFSKKMADEIYSYFKKKDRDELVVICVTQQAANLFQEYLGEENE